MAEAPSRIPDDARFMPRRPNIRHLWHFRQGDSDLAAGAPVTMKDWKKNLGRTAQLQEESIPRGMQMRAGAGGGEAMVL